jgi:hypothetical protein
MKKVILILVLGLLLSSNALAEFLICEFDDGLGEPWILKKNNGTWCHQTPYMEEDDCDQKISDDTIFISYKLPNGGFQDFEVNRFTGRFSLNTKMSDDIKDFSKGICKMRKKKKF